MLQEIFLGEKLKWPAPFRCAVNLVFNYQGAEGLEADSKGRIDAEEYARREYGPRVGIWRVLRVLEKYNLRRHLSSAAPWRSDFRTRFERSTPPAMMLRGTAITMKKPG